MVTRRDWRFAAKRGGAESRRDGCLAAARRRMLTRRDWLFAAAVLATGCATPGRPIEESFPASLAGGWTLRRSSPVRPEDAPADVRSAGLNRAARAEYSGEAEVSLTLYETKSSGNAFELLQHWRAAEGKMAFQHGRFFGVAESQTAGHPVLRRFIDAFEKKFSG